MTEISDTTSTLGRVWSLARAAASALECLSVPSDPPCLQMCGRVHVPVLLSECIAALNVHARSAGTFADLTLGAAGHAVEVLQNASLSARLVGVDRDAVILEHARNALVDYQDRCHLFNTTSDQIQVVLQSLQTENTNQDIVLLDGVLLDLGISSLQVDTPERGFSFMHDGPLDMRMGSDADMTAADVLANHNRAELQYMLETFGEEQYASKIAEAITAHRPRDRPKTTSELVSIVESVKPRPYMGRKARVRSSSSARLNSKRARSKKNWKAPKPIHPATKTFQALRIVVNDELGMLQRTLSAVTDPRVLAPGARFAVISFHSLEDRIVRSSNRSDAPLPYTSTAFSYCVLSRVFRPALPGEKLFSVITPSSTSSQETNHRHGRRASIKPEVSQCQTACCRIFAGI